MPATITPDAPSSETLTSASIDVSYKRPAAPSNSTSPATAAATVDAPDLTPTPFHSARTRPLDALVFSGIVLFVVAMMGLVLLAY